MRLHSFARRKREIEEDPKMEPWSDYMKDVLLEALRKEEKSPTSLTDAETGLIFYFARHQDDPVFDFVPERYRHAGRKSGKAKGKPVRGRDARHR